VAGFGLDVGTLGAVGTAADLLAQAAHTARRIVDAAPVPVHRYGQVVAYPVGTVAPGDLDPDDIIAVPATPHPGGGNLRLLGVANPVRRHPPHHRPRPLPRRRHRRTRRAPRPAA